MNIKQSQKTQIPSAGPSSWKKFISNPAVRYPLLVITIIIMAGGAVNNGFTWFLFALPFTFVYYLVLKHIPRPQSIIILVLTAAIIIPLGWNHPENKLLYPYIGSQITVPSGWAYWLSPSTGKLKLVEPQNIEGLQEFKREKPEFYGEYLVMASEDAPFTFVRVERYTTGFYTKFIFVFESVEGEELEIKAEHFIDGLRNGKYRTEDIPAEVFNDNKADMLFFQSEWTYWLGNLMYGPMLPLVIFNYNQSLSPPAP